MAVKLFERFGRSGASFQSEIRTSKKIEGENFQSDAAESPSATLIPLAVEESKKQFPEVEISIKTGRPNEIEQWILSNDVPS